MKAWLTVWWTAEA